MSVTLANDERLVDDTLAGNPAAYGQLVRKYQDRLFHSVKHILGSACDAEDVVQEALVQAFVKLETFERSSTFYTWVYRIAVNMALSHRRRRKPTVSIEIIHQNSGREPTDRNPGPDHRLLRQENVAKVHEALDKLPDEYRTVLVLREMDDMPYEDIAEILEIPVGTVRSRLHRGRIELRMLLKEESK